MLSQGAHELHPRLEGVAWKVQCQSSHNGKEIRSGLFDYYLEELGVWLSDIGESSFSKNTYELSSVIHSLTVGE